MFLLKNGSVQHAIMIEKQWGKYLPEIKLTQTIGKSSPHKFLFFWNIHSKHKFRIFYGLLLGTLVLLGFILVFTNN